MRKKQDKLQRIPGVGKSIAKDLQQLEIYKISDLIGLNPEMLYQQLCDVKNCKVDRCMLYVFRCAVYFAEHEEYETELLKWWNWKDKKYESEDID